MITSLLTGRARPCARGERVPAHGTSSLAAGGCRSADGGRNGRPEPSAVQSGQATPCPDRVLADLRRRAWRGGAANGGRPRHGRGKGGAGGATALVTVLITAQAMAPCVAGSAPVILEPEHTSGGSRLRSESRSIAAPVSPNLTRMAARPRSRSACWSGGHERNTGRPCASAAATVRTGSRQPSMAPYTSILPGRGERRAWVRLRLRGRHVRQRFGENVRLAFASKADSLT